jgi:hypothetical protein
MKFIVLVDSPQLGVQREALQCREIPCAGSGATQTARDGRTSDIESAKGADDASVAKLASISCVLSAIQKDACDYRLCHRYK